MHLPLALHLADAVEDPQDALLNVWITAWDGHQLLSDPSHLFDANIFYSYPRTLAYSELLLGNALLDTTAAFANPICVMWRLTIRPEGYALQPEVRQKMYKLAESKLRQEQIAKALHEESTDENEKIFLKGIAKSNRLMAEDFMREGGYLLPQSNNVKALLSYLQESDFPEAEKETMKNLLRDTTHRLLQLL